MRKKHDDSVLLAVLLVWFFIILVTWGFVAYVIFRVLEGVL